MLLLLVFWLRDKNQPTSTLVLEAPDFHPPSENLDQVVRDFRDTRGEATSDGEATMENHGTMLQAWHLEGGDKEQRDTSIALRPWKGRSI